MTTTEVPPSKKRYDEDHPTVSVRISDDTRKKLEKYKKERMTWADLAAEGLEYKEKQLNREEQDKEIKQQIQKNSGQINEVSEKIDELQELYKKLQTRLKEFEVFFARDILGPEWKVEGGYLVHKKKRL